MAVESLLSLQNPVFKAYMFYSAILVVKLLAMAFLTGRQRMKKKVFANQEDCMDKNCKVKTDDPDIERVRRAHLNDLENIPAFWIAGLLYTLTNPSYFLAVNLFRVAAAGRILHTIVYAVFVVPQPARALSFAACFLPTIYMAINVILACL